MASHPDFCELYGRAVAGGRSHPQPEDVRRIWPFYCDDVFFAVVCDDQLFVKVTPQGEAAFPRPAQGPAL